MAEITIYCDNELCGYNEDGFCWADRVCINANGECTEVVYHWSYFEVFGLTEDEFNDLQDFYEKLLKERKDANSNG